jgi:hypothetical protein
VSSNTGCPYGYNFKRRLRCVVHSTATVVSIPERCCEELYISTAIQALRASHVDAWFGQKVTAHVKNDRESGLDEIRGCVLSGVIEP